MSLIETVAEAMHAAAEKASAAGKHGVEIQAHMILAAVETLNLTAMSPEIAMEVAQLPNLRDRVQALLDHGAWIKHAEERISALEALARTPAPPTAGTPAEQYPIREMKGYGAGVFEAGDREAAE